MLEGRVTSTSFSASGRASEMNLSRHKTVWHLATALILSALMPALPAQQKPAVPPQEQKPTVPLGPPSTLPGAGQGVVLDKVIAVVNDDLILESDVEEEQGFES